MEHEIKHKVIIGELGCINYKHIFRCGPENGRSISRLIYLYKHIQAESLIFKI